MLASEITAAANCALRGRYSRKYGSEAEGLEDGPGLEDHGIDEYGAWEESKHPRDDGGQFTSGQQGGSVAHGIRDFLADKRNAEPAPKLPQKPQQLIPRGEGAGSPSQDVLDDLRASQAQSRINPGILQSIKDKVNALTKAAGLKGKFSRSGRKSRLARQFDEVIGTSTARYAGLWEESKHPRANDGKFTSGGDGGSAPDPKSQPNQDSGHPPKQEEDSPTDGESLFTPEEQALPAKAQQPQNTPDAVYSSAAENLPNYQQLLNLGKGLVAQLPGGRTVDASKDPSGFGKLLDEAGDALEKTPDGQAPDLPPTILIAPLKKRSGRATDKVRDKYGGDWSRLQDVVRASVIVSSKDELSSTMDSIRGEMEKQGWSMASQPTNRFDNPTPAGYGDIQLALRAPNGQVCELQVHTYSMWHAKEAKGHKLFEEYRTLDEQQASGKDIGASGQQKLESLARDMKRLYGSAKRKM